MRGFASLCLAGLLAFSFCVAAAVVPKPLMGQWQEKGADGGIRWELSPDQISIAPLDAAGNPAAEPNQIDVLYEPAGAGWAIVVVAHDGSPIGEGQARIENGTLLVVFPGVIGTHELTRVGAAEPDPPKPRAKSKPRPQAQPAPQ